MRYGAGRGRTCLSGSPTHLRLVVVLLTRVKWSVVLELVDGAETAVLDPSFSLNLSFSELIMFR